jgi:hypothetical protein
MRKNLSVSAPRKFHKSSLRARQRAATKGQRRANHIQIRKSVANWIGPKAIVARASDFDRFLIAFACAQFVLPRGSIISAPCWRALKARSCASPQRLIKCLHRPPPPLIEAFNVSATAAPYRAASGRAQLGNLRAP